MCTLLNKNDTDTCTACRTKRTSPPAVPLTADPLSAPSDSKAALDPLLTQCILSDYPGSQALGDGRHCIFAYKPDGTILVLHVSSHNQVVVTEAFREGSVPVSRRAAIAALLSDVNAQLLRGRFVLNSADGELRMECSFSVNALEMHASALLAVLHDSIDYLTRTFPVLLQVFDEVCDAPLNNRHDEAESPSNPLASHNGFVCSYCLTALPGNRYHCTQCRSYDLCSKCYSAGKVSHAHKAQHLMVAFRPRQFLGVWCAACGVEDFSGLRYKCDECVDVTLCSVCYRSGAHDPSHSVSPCPGADTATAASSPKSV